MVMKNSTRDSKRNKKERKTEKLELGESVRAVEDRVRWKRIVETSSVVLKRPSKLRG